jgi:hypothetical protein
MSRNADQKDEVLEECYKAVADGLIGRKDIKWPVRGAFSLEKASREGASLMFSFREGSKPQQKKGCALQYYGKDTADVYCKDLVGNLRHVAEWVGAEIAYSGGSEFRMNRKGRSG